MQKRLIDTSSELQIYRYKQGIKLLRPDADVCRHHQLINTNQTIGDLAQLSFNSFFMNAAGELQFSNDANIQSMGFDSIKQCIGKTIYDAIDSDSSSRLRKNDLLTTSNADQYIFDEGGIRKKDHVLVNALSIKMPWYDANDQVIGLFGFGIMIGTHSIAAAINNLIKADFLTHRSTKLPGNYIDEIYFSQREIQIIHLTVRGKTAREIGIQLHLSIRTVEHYLENIKRKMDVGTKSELIEKVIDYFL